MMDGNISFDHASELTASAHGSNEDALRSRIEQYAANHKSLSMGLVMKTRNPGDSGTESKA